MLAPPLGNPLPLLPSQKFRRQLHLQAAPSRTDNDTLPARGCLTYHRSVPTRWQTPASKCEPTTMRACYRIRHKDFLRPAKDHKAVSHAMRFVQLLPSHMTDARTYNMLVSVCIAARDLPMALKAGTMLKDSGRQLDTFLYTNLITACATKGDADMGFRLYEDMLNDGVPTDPRVYTALISVCSGKIRMSENDSSRRGQLVLLERAFGVFHDMQVGLLLCPDQNKMISYAVMHGAKQQVAVLSLGLEHASQLSVQDLHACFEASHTCSMLIAGVLCILSFRVVRSTWHMATEL